MYAAIRKITDPPLGSSRREYVCWDEIGPTMEEVIRVVNDNADKSPSWNSFYPVDRISLVNIVEQETGKILR